MKQTLIIVFIVILGAFLGSACAAPTGNDTLVVYTSVDQPFSEPVLMAFEAQTGIRVQAVYDVEAAKTTGLVNRLIAEKDNPQADVFWNGEFAQTLLLQEEGILAAYKSPNAKDIPVQYVDPDGYWTGLGGRARILLVNTNLLQRADYPRSIFNLVNELYPAEKIGMAYPLFGTAATQAAALYAAMGAEEARSYFQALADRGIQVVDGNSVVRDMVADGQLMIGLTDTDDACSAVEKGAPVKIIIPDQGAGEMGTLIIPNTVALIAGAPHPEAARKFIDYLLSVETEKALLESGWSQISLRHLAVKTECLDTTDIQGMPTSLAEIYEQFALAKQEMTEIFVR